MVWYRTTVAPWPDPTLGCATVHLVEPLTRNDCFISYATTTMFTLEEEKTNN